MGWRSVPPPREGPRPALSTASRLDGLFYKSNKGASLGVPHPDNLLKCAFHSPVKCHFSKFCATFSRPHLGWGITLHCPISPTSLPHRAMHIYPKNHLSPPKTFLSSFPPVIVLLTVWQLGADRILPSAWVLPAQSRTPGRELLPSGTWTRNSPR